MPRKRNDRKNKADLRSGPPEVNMGHAERGTVRPREQAANTSENRGNTPSCPYELDEELLKRDQPAHLVFSFGLEQGLERVSVHLIARRGGGLVRLRCLGPAPCPACAADYPARDIPLLIAWDAHVRDWTVLVLDQDWKERILDDLEGIESVGRDLSRRLVVMTRDGPWSADISHERAVEKALPKPQDLDRLGDPKTALRAFIPSRTTEEIIERCPEVRLRLDAKGLLEGFLRRKK